ncbi:hypothetical protein ACFLXO_05090 [Chloroflexota bacterium]
MRIRELRGKLGCFSPSSWKEITNSVWCERCDSMASAKTCPHSDEDHLVISGTRLCEMLTEGEKLPEKFSRKEEVDILVRYYQS